MPTILQVASGTDTTAAGTVSATFGATPQVGNLLVLAWGTGSGLAGTFPAGLTTQVANAIFTRVFDGSESLTWTVTYTPNGSLDRAQLTIFEISNFDSVNPIDASGSASINQNGGSVTLAATRSGDIAIEAGRAVSSDVNSTFGNNSVSPWTAGGLIPQQNSASWNIAACGYQTGQPNGAVTSTYGVSTDALMFTGSVSMVLVKALPIATKNFDTSTLDVPPVIRSSAAAAGINRAIPFSWFTPRFNVPGPFTVIDSRTLDVAASAIASNPARLTALPPFHFWSPQVLVVPPPTNTIRDTSTFLIAAQIAGRSYRTTASGMFLDFGIPQPPSVPALPPTIMDAQTFMIAAMIAGRLYATGGTRMEAVMPPENIQSFPPSAFGKNCFGFGPGGVSIKNLPFGV